MGDTSIEWTDKTWNPTRGCSRVSPGCVNCYAERQAARFARPSDGHSIENGPFYGFVQRKNGHASWTGKVELIESKLTEPLSWRKPARVFVNSMSDLFHEALPLRDIDAVFAVMSQAPQHTFQVLTKRAECLREYMKSERTPEGIDEQAGRFQWCHSNIDGRWPLPNVWLGVSVEDRKNKDRIEYLRETPAAVRFLSIEPQLEDLGELDLTGIHWVIVGGESGPGARPFSLEWASRIIGQCKAAGVSVFCKQLGAKPLLNGVPYNPHGVYKNDFSGRPAGLYDKKGGNVMEWPEELQVREFPV